MKKIVLIICCVLLLATILSGCKKQDIVSSNNIVPSANGKHEIGASESIIECADTMSIAVHYPVIGKADIDKQIVENVQTKIKRFKQECAALDNEHDNNNQKSEFNVEYESYKYDNICSIVLKIFDHKIFDDQPENKIDTMVFSLTSQNLLCISDILKDEYSTKLADIVYDNINLSDDLKTDIDKIKLQSLITSSEQTFKRFYITKDYIVFYIENNNYLSGCLSDPVIKIPIFKLSDLIKKNQDLQDIPDTSLPDTEYSPVEKPERVIDPNAEYPPVKKPDRVIDPNKPMVALTFDDGPHCTNTPEILETLIKNNAVATFFVLGQRVSSNKMLIRNMLNQGCEIGNHSYSHKQLNKLSDEQIKNEFDMASTEVYKATNHYPTLMRPPYGIYNDKIKAIANLPIIYWSIDTEDWKYRDTEKIYTETLAKVKDGDIILMHDIYKTSVEAAKKLIPELTKRGYQLVTVSEMIEAKGNIPTAGKVYSSQHKK